MKQPEWIMKFDIVASISGLDGEQMDDMRDFIRETIKSELENIFSRLPSKDDPLSREEMLDIIEEQRRKVGIK